MESSGKNSRKDLTKILVEAGLIAEEQLQRVIELQHKTGDKVERILLQQRLITPQQLAFFTSLHLGIPFINLKKEGVKPDAVKLIPETVARKYGVIPVDTGNGAIVIAMEDPKDIEALEELAAVTMKRI